MQKSWKVSIILWAIILGFSASVMAGDIHDAAAKGDLERVKALIKAQPKLINVKENDKNKQTPIHYAVINGRDQVIKFLLSKGADINAQNLYGNASLHLAVKSSHENIVKLLLEHGADYKQKNWSSQSAMFLATVAPGHLDILKTLHKHGADLSGIHSIFGNTLLHTAAKEGYDDIVRFLLNQGVSIHRKNHLKATPLYEAVHYKKPKVVQTLIDYGASVYQEYPVLGTAMDIALSNKNLEIVKMLLLAGDWPKKENEEGKTILWKVVKEVGNPVIFKINQNLENLNNMRSVLDRYPNLVTKKDSAGETLLHHAVKIKNRDMAKMLLERGININVRTTQGFQPLHLAAHACDMEMIQLLLESKAEVNGLAYFRRVTPLDIAALKEDKDVVSLLEKYGGKKGPLHK
jgi:ankyrin repeat protein